jgi:hypothetical protein
VASSTREQILLADARCTAHDLPLSDGIHGIDVIDTLFSFPVSLVDGIHPQVAGAWRTEW